MADRGGEEGWAQNWKSHSEIYCMSLSMLTILYIGVVVEAVMEIVFSCFRCKCFYLHEPFSKHCNSPAYILFSLLKWLSSTHHV